MLAVGEENGHLTIIHPQLRLEKASEKEKLENIHPLSKVYYDKYQFMDSIPGFTSEDAVTFERDKEGRGISLRVGENNFNRFFTPSEDGKSFRVKPAEKLSVLRTQVAKEIVPKHRYSATANLVELSTVVPYLHYDLRYATANNLFGEPLVVSQKAYLDKEAALALGKVQQRLKPYGYGLIVWEAYRSWQDFKVAVLALGPKYRGMLPKPEKGFSHCTGRAIAVSLYNLNDGQAVPMISDFDEITPAQYKNYLGSTSLKRWQRDLLIASMEAEGFTGSEMEWWHFDYQIKTSYQWLNTVLD